MRLNEISEFERLMRNMNFKYGDRVIANGPQEFTGTIIDASITIKWTGDKEVTYLIKMDAHGSMFSLSQEFLNRLE